MNIKCSEVDNYNICLEYYNLISLMFEEEIKYIRNYKILLSDYFKKVLFLQVNIGSKLGQLPEEFSKSTSLKYSHILKLTQHIPKMIQKQLESINIFMEEFEKSIKTIDDYLKEKSNLVKSLQVKYEDSSQELIKKYNDVDNAKITFLSSIEKTEDIIAKFYKNKKKIKTEKINKKNDGDLKLLYDKDKEFETQKKNIIKSTKKLEKEYNNIINNTKKYEDKFINTINDSINGIKNISCDLSDKLKDILIIFFNSFRDSFKIPLDLIDGSLSNLKETNQKEIISKTIINSFNKENNFMNTVPEKYNLKSIELINNENKEKEKKGFFWNKIKKNKDKDQSKDKYIQFEDGFEEMSYFEDETVLYTAKEMFDNFELIDNIGLNLEIEEEKIITKNLICNIISSMSNKSNFEYSYEDENNNLLNLLNKHHNRIIFLHKLNDYRALCKFELNEKAYNLLGILFSYIIDISKTEKDYHCLEMVIILSKTYYILKEKDNKIYLQNYIIYNKVFKLKEFWEELLIYSISKEVSKSNKREKIGREDQKKLKTNNENIIFSQLLSLIDNMFDFGAEENLVKEIIEPKMDFYKLDDKFKSTLNNEIVNKKKSINNKEKSKK